MSNPRDYHYEDYVAGKVRRGRERLSRERCETRGVRTPTEALSGWTAVLVVGNAPGKTDWHWFGQRDRRLQYYTIHLTFPLLILTLFSHCTTHVNFSFVSAPPPVRAASPSPLGIFKFPPRHPSFLKVAFPSAYLPSRSADRRFRHADSTSATTRSHLIKQNY